MQRPEKRGFKFVGSTIVYPYLQSIGIINAHWEESEYRQAGFTTLQICG